jgi:hypothetical protein
MTTHPSSASVGNNENVMINRADELIDSRAQAKMITGASATRIANNIQTLSYT